MLTMSNLSNFAVIANKPIQTQPIVIADDPIPYVELGVWNENLGYLNQIVVNGTIAYIADYSENLFIFDLENLSNPLLLNTYRSDALPYSINDILFINESLIILAKSSYGLEIIDCSNFSNINSVYSYTQTNYVTSLAFKDPYLYATDNVDGLHIFDLSDLNDVQYITNISSAGSAHSIRILDQYAYIASSSAGIKIFDLFDPINPVEVGNFTDGSLFFELDVEGNFVYAIDDQYTFKILNVSDVSNPIKLGEFNGSNFDDLVISNDIAFISTSSHGFSILNCTNPTTIVEIVNIIIPFDAFDVISDIYVGQDYFYLISWYQGVEIFSISSLPALQTVARIGDGSVNEILIENNIAYLADGFGGVVIVDVSNPQSPIKLGEFNEGGRTYGLCYSNDMLFVANYELGLQILNVEDPTHPTKLGSFYDGGNATGVTVRGNRAYLADGSDGFEIIDISNPEAPTEIAQGEEILFFDYYKKIQIIDDEAYLLDTDGLAIYSISEDTGDTLGEALGSYIGGNPSDFIVINDVAYLAGGRIDVVDVSDPEDPLLISYYLGSFINLFLEGDVLFASSDNEIHLFNITNPNQLSEIGDFALSDSITDLFYSKGVLYLSHSGSANDLQIITFDRDLDGLNDYEEENVYHTDPNNPDTDGDGLTDGEEVIEYETDPLNPDSDGDGLTDGEEIQVYGTDPLDEDTDDDGYSDGEEIRRGSDPLDPLSVPSFRYWLLFVGLFSSLAFTALITFLGIIIRKKIILRKELVTQEKERDQLVIEQKIFINLVTLDSGKDYSTEQIAVMLQLDKSEVKEILTLWSTTGVLDKIGSFDENEDIFTRKTTKKRTSKKFKCYYCSQKNNLGNTICSKCGFEIAICISCDKPIGYGELVASCPNCKTLNHLEHLAKHIKSHGHCPKCNKRLELGQLSVPLEHLSR